IEYALPIVRKIRKAGIPAEIYSEEAKIKKQMQYANDKKIPFVAIVGDDEMKANAVMLKDMTTGVQRLVAVEDIVKEIQ
ncbi:MAG: histidine--tRNA ligase, partial [Bacteroidetes bacterium]|nr:histidine--tRNA ligase [Bacteroidota bacterium]